MKSVCQTGSSQIRVQVGLVGFFQFAVVPSCQLEVPRLGHLLAVLDEAGVFGAPDSQARVQVRILVIKEKNNANQQNKNTTDCSKQ